MKAQTYLDTYGPVIAQKLDYLQQRWQDEQEYEDWAEYEKEIQRTFPGATKIVKKPIGFTKDCDDGTLKVWIHVTKTTVVVKATLIGKATLIEGGTK
jgi:hypothetical protein